MAAAVSSRSSGKAEQRSAVVTAVAAAAPTTAPRERSTPHPDRHCHRHRDTNISHGFKSMLRFDYVQQIPSYRTSHRRQLESGRAGPDRTGPDRTGSVTERARHILPSLPGPAPLQHRTHSLLVACVNIFNKRFDSIRIVTR